MEYFSFPGLCLWICLITATSTLESEQVILRGVRGLDAELPCGQGKVFLDGPNSYVLWMKDNKEFLYRYPDEDSSRSTSIQAYEQVFAPRCKRNSCQEPTSLQLKHLGEHDGGSYSCRVHYQASPTVDYSIELRLVDSPGMPKIFNVEGLDLSGGVTQLNLGTDMTIICEVKDDHLGTLVWWERNGVEIARAESVINGVLRSSVAIVNASRDELDVHYECLAQNADVTDPLSASVVIKMHLPPMSVEIRLNNNLDFEAGLPRVVDCVVVGCVPPPTITWHLGEVMLRPSVHKELHDGNFTVSSLTLAPSVRDDKHALTCRAHNSHLPREVFEDKVVLNVGFRPVCLNDHEEVIGYMAGQTEHVTCTVEAYPAPMQFSWTFADTKTLYTSAKKVRGYQHRYSSSLTWKPQDQDQGELLCRATNVLGEQKRPCVFSIVTGGPPLTPNCELINTEPKTIKISCKKSWDGGRPQTIHLEVRNSENTVHNVSDTYGHFALPQFQDTQNFTAVVYASNSRGRSDARVLQIAMNSSEAETHQVPNKMDLWLGLVIGTVLFGTVLAILARCMKFLQNTPLRNLAGRHTECTNLDEEPTITIHDGSLHRQPQPQPLSQLGPYPLASVRVPSGENHYMFTPTKASRLLGVDIASSGSEERFHGVVNENNMSTYYV